MGEIKIFDKNDLIKFCRSCPVFEKYWRYNLWSKECVEYNQLKYCNFHLSRYILNFIKDFILRHCSLYFSLILYDSPIFIKFIKSRFIKYVDFSFLVFFKKKFLCIRGALIKILKKLLIYFSKGILEKKKKTSLLSCQGG